MLTAAMLKLILNEREFNIWLQETMVGMSNISRYWLLLTLLGKSVAIESTLTMRHVFTSRNGTSTILFDLWLYLLRRCYSSSFFLRIEIHSIYFSLASWVSLGISLVIFLHMKISIFPFSIRLDNILIVQIDCVKEIE